MTTATKFRVNAPDVILENFGDEVVIVNLGNGNYYSVDNVGAEVWALLEKGMPVTGVVADLVNRYSGDRAEIENALARFLADLQSDSLIVPLEGDGPPMESKGEAESAVKQPFTAPVLNKYTDMQELLLLDPIHEVDETGWPTMKPDGQ